MAKQQVKQEFPHSREAEQALLSSIMQLPAKWLIDLGDQLSPEHFYFVEHQMVYSALQRMFDAKKLIDLFTITDFLRDDGQLASVGGAAYLTELYNAVPSSAGAEFYLDTVKRKWMRRHIILTATDLLRESYDETSGEEQVLLDSAQEKITSLSLDATRSDVIKHVKHGMEQVLVDMKAVFKKRGHAATLGHESGFKDLDRQTGGIQDQQFIIVGARPSQGKTSVLTNMVAHMAVEKKISVMFFTMEMSYHQVCRRLAACNAGVNLQHFRDGFFAHRNTWDAFYDRTAKSFEPLMGAPIWIDETPALSIAMFKARARRAVVGYGVQAVFVDYLGLMRGGNTTNRKDYPRWLEITEISQAMKNTAKELNIPVIAAAQLNREPEGRAFGKPQMGDFRDSGSLEQDADVLLLLWRPVKHIEHHKDRDRLARGLKLSWHNDEPLYTTPDKKELTSEEIEERDRQLEEYAELRLEKQRDGSTNPVRLRFVGEETKFYNVTTKDYSSKEEERQQNIEEI